MGRTIQLRSLTPSTAGAIHPRAQEAIADVADGVISAEHIRDLYSR